MDWITRRIAALRARSAFVDHVLRMQSHYGSSQASQQAGAVTYFGFLSFFPILALAVFVISLVSKIYPEANADLLKAINDIFPGVIGGGKNEVSLSTVKTFSGVFAVVGVLGVLYSGLGWVSALRNALTAVFTLPAAERPNFIVGKGRDLKALIALGTILIVSVAVTGVIGGASTTMLGLVGLGDTLSPLVGVLSFLLGFAANCLLFFLMFKLLVEPDPPLRSLWSGALFGALGFEVLKQASTYLIKLTSGQPAGQAFGIALILVVLINYFSRVILYAAAWAYTTPLARAMREAEVADPMQGPSTPSLADHPLVAGERSTWVGPFAAGGAAALGLVALARRTIRD